MKVTYFLFQRDSMIPRQQHHDVRIPAKFYFDLLANGKWSLWVDGLSLYSLLNSAPFVSVVHHSIRTSRSIIVVGR